MKENHGKTYEEVQLDFGFVSEATLITPVSHESRRKREPHAGRSRGLADTLTTAHAALLDASLNDLHTHLLPLFEFCEAALTRALDVVPLRKEELFSAEEYRSLRGVGQAQWLLAEARAREKAKEGERQTRKSKVKGQKSKVKSQGTGA